MHDLAMSASGHDLRAAPEHEHVVSLEPRLHLANVRAIHDRGSMHAKEYPGIESLVQTVHRLAHDERPARAMQAQLLPARFDPLDLVWADEHMASVDLDD